MTLPASVARRAYQAAIRGATSSFFFVRRFVNPVGGPDEFVAVVCRMTGGTAGSPFSLTNVELGFSGTDKPILFAKAGEKLPQIEARINYTGTGRLMLVNHWLNHPGETYASRSAPKIDSENSLPVFARDVLEHVLDGDHSVAAVGLYDW